MCYSQKCKVVSLNLAHPVYALHYVQAKRVAEKVWLNILCLTYFITYVVCALLYLQCYFAVLLRFEIDHRAYFGSICAVTCNKYVILNWADLSF